MNELYEILALTLRYWFAFLILYIFWQSFKATWRIARNHENEIIRTGNIPFVLVMFALTAFGLLAINNPEGIDTNVAVTGVLVSALFLFQYYIIYYIYDGIDGHLLLIFNTLAIIGFIMLQRLSPELAMRQIEWFAVGCLFLIALIIITPILSKWDKLMIPMMIIGCIMLFIPVIWGEEVYGARRWLTIGQFVVQPSEFFKILYIVILALSLKEKKNFNERIPLFVFTALSIILVVLQKDLGSALHYALLFIFMYYVSTSDWLITAGAFASAVLGSIVSYSLFSHVRVRVDAWRNPWADIEGRGYQVAQSLIAIGSGGIVGTGLGLGSPYIVPASRTDFIFSAICEEFGVLVGGAIIGFYAIIVIRGICISLGSNNIFYMLLAMGASTSLGVQGFIIIGGVTKLIPLTGITMPFVSYGGSSILVSMGLIGIIEAVAVRTKKEEESNEDGDESNINNDGIPAENGDDTYE